MVVMRGLFLRGAGFSDLLLPLSVLLVMDVFFIALAVKLFKKDVEP
jgi:hypothetical protein